MDALINPRQWGCRVLHSSTLCPSLTGMLALGVSVPLLLLTGCNINDLRISVGGELFKPSIQEPLHPRGCEVTLGLNVSLTAVQECQHHKKQESQNQQWLVDRNAMRELRKERQLL